MNSFSAYHSRPQADYSEASKDYSTRPPNRYRATSVDPFRSLSSSAYHTPPLRNDLIFPVSSSGSGLSRPPPHCQPTSCRCPSLYRSPIGPMPTTGRRYRTTERSDFPLGPSPPRSCSLSKFVPPQPSPVHQDPTYDISRSANNYHAPYIDSHYPSHHHTKYSYDSSMPPFKRSSCDIAGKFTSLSMCPSAAYGGTSAGFRPPSYSSTEPFSCRERQIEVEIKAEETPKTKFTSSTKIYSRDSSADRREGKTSVTMGTTTTSRSSSGRSTSPTDVNRNNTTSPTSSASASVSSGAYERRSSGLHGGRAVTAASSSTASMSSSSNAVDTNSSSASPTFSGGLVGLSNLGNTCFMNSVIQCLSNTHELLRVCIDYVYQSDLNVNSSMKGNLFTAYADLMRQMWVSSSSTTSAITYVSPQRFRSQVQKFAPRFMGYAQQDAQEFLRYLVQGLHEDVNRVTTRPSPDNPDYDKEDRMPDTKKAALYWQRYKRIDDSIIADLFLGQLMSTLECMSCGHKSTTFDPFWDLSLPIPRGNVINILNCFDLFTSNEILDGAEQPTCSGCKRRQPCRKSLSIQRFPTIMVIHFKRFSGERSRSKLTTFIDYPIDHLDLNRYAAHCSPETNASYHLYAVSNHSGSVFGGHYTAYCLHPKLGSWYEFNDTRVRPIRQNEVVTSEAYVLFYERIDGGSA